MFTLLGWSRYVHATGVVSVCSRYWGGLGMFSEFIRHLLDCLCDLDFRVLVDIKYYEWAR